ncbi:MAG: hypothetical protein M1826_007278 [Phylliscum demangeonii]|nr:MAG: hypothetical protein M1826_007278 [Phylliscum demangeonii]
MHCPSQESLPRKESKPSDKDIIERINKGVERVDDNSIFTRSVSRSRVITPAIHRRRQSKLMDRRWDQQRSAEWVFHHDDEDHYQDELHADDDYHHGNGLDNDGDRSSEERVDDKPIFTRSVSRSRRRWKEQQSAKWVLHHEDNNQYQDDLPANDDGHGNDHEADHDGDHEAEHEAEHEADHNADHNATTMARATTTRPAVHPAELFAATGVLTVGLQVAGAPVTAAAARRASVRGRARHVRGRAHRVRGRAPASVVSHTGSEPGAGQGLVGDAVAAVADVGDAAAVAADVADVVAAAADVADAVVAAAVAQPARRRGGRLGRQVYYIHIWHRLEHNSFAPAILQYLAKERGRQAHTYPVRWDRDRDRWVMGPA